MSAIRHLIAVDLDGTLFGADGQVSARTVRTLALVAELGHAVVAVTGRSRLSAAVRLQGIACIERIVCSNGAYEFLTQPEKITWSRTVEMQTGRGWMARLRERMPSVSFGHETLSGLFYEPAFIAAAGVPDGLEHGGDPHHSDTTPLLKLFIRAPGLTSAELQSTAQRVLGDAAEVTTSGAPFVEASAPGVDKASGLAIVAEDLGIERANILAFGDNHNDLSMLRWAGRSVAMGNALPEVIALAHHTTLPNVDDGVAVYLQGLLDENRL